MTEESQQDQRATRRGVLLGVGLAGMGGVLSGCSTAAVPYLANETGQAPGPQAPGPSASSGMADQAAGGAMGTLLGLVKDIPVGGGRVFMAQKVIVTQPASGVLRAFSAVCTHVGCICNKVANGTISCPCHGSEFKITDGAVITGPAPAPLTARTIAVSDGKILLR